MKSFVLTAVLLAAGFAQARTVTCSQTAQDVHNSDQFEGALTLEIPSAKAQSIQLKVKGSDGKVYVYNADFDEHDSTKDLDEDGYNSYNLDENYTNKEARFVTSDGDLAGSDGDSVVFVDKTILKGQKGSVSLSGGQANDGDGGNAWGWGRAYIFSNCK